MPCSFAAGILAAMGHVFLASSCHFLSGDLLYLIRNKVDYFIQSKSGYCVLVIRFVRDRYARAKAAGGC